MFYELNILIPFILTGLFLDIFIFHHFRKDGDMFDTPDKHKKGTVAQYVNCCLCHGFSIGCVLTLFFPSVSWVDVLSGGMIMGISALTYRIKVIK